MGKKTSGTGLEEDKGKNLRLTCISPFAAAFAILLISAVIVTCGGCQNAYLDIGSGIEVQPIFRGDSNWQGSGPIVEIALRKHWDMWFCQYAHTSNLSSGPPFNNDTETTLDRVTCGRSFRLNQ